MLEAVHAQPRLQHLAKRYPGFIDAMALTQNSHFAATSGIAIKNKASGHHSGALGRVAIKNKASGHSLWMNGLDVWDKWNFKLGARSSDLDKLGEYMFWTLVGFCTEDGMIFTIYNDGSCHDAACACLYAQEGKDMSEG